METDATIRRGCTTNSIDWAGIYRTIDTYFTINAYKLIYGKVRYFNPTLDPPVDETRIRDFYTDAQDPNCPVTIVLEKGVDEYDPIDYLTLDIPLLTEI